MQDRPRSSERRARPSDDRRNRQPQGGAARRSAMGSSSYAQTRSSEGVAPGISRSQRVQPHSSAPRPHSNAEPGIARRQPHSSGSSRPASYHSEGIRREPVFENRLDNARRRPSESGNRHTSAEHFSSRRPIRERSGNRTPSQPKPSKKKRSPQTRRRILALVLCAIVVCAALFLIKRGRDRRALEDTTYANNIYINGHSFSGYTQEGAREYAAELADEWLNETFTFSYMDSSWSFSRSMVDATIDYSSQLDLAWNLGHVGSERERERVRSALESQRVDYPVTVTYDEAKLDAFIDTICSALHIDAIDAVVVPDVNQPVIVSESQIGRDVNREQFRQQLITLIETGESDTTIPVDTVMPTVQSDEVSFQLIAEFSTDVTFRNSASRSNVRKALNAFNGLEIQPGVTYDFNEIVGPRTMEAGFQQATEYNGDVSTLGWGGGVCQASTTLYNALIQANMTVLNRKNHTMTVSYVDPSLDAAVEWGGKNLVFTNDTQYPVYIYTAVSKEWATVRIYGHRPDYRYVLESVMINENRPSTRQITVQDTEGKYVYYTDDEPYVETGKPGCSSQGWIVAYDWNTHEEVSRVQVSEDTYSPGATLIYVGVHERNTVLPTTDAADPGY